MQFSLQSRHPNSVNPWIRKWKIRPSEDALEQCSVTNDQAATRSQMSCSCRAARIFEVNRI